MRQVYHASLGIFLRRNYLFLVTRENGEGSKGNMNLKMSSQSKPNEFSLI